MKTNLEFLVGLMGKTKAEGILQDYVRKGWKGEATPKTIRKNGSGYALLGRKEWGNTDLEQLALRYKDLVILNWKKGKIIKKLGQEFGRTPSAIWQRLNKIGLLKQSD